jgi:ABC-type multidrug transport system fused ATPase/permease subunit
MTDAASHPPPTPLPALYRQMWMHARGARPHLIGALALQLGSQGLKLALPWIAAQAINAVQTGGRAGLATAAVWVAWAMALHVASWLLHGPARVLERRAALQVRRSVADALYARLVHAPLAWHDRHHSGDLHHRTMQASDALGGFTQSQFMYLHNLIQLAGPLLALWWLSALTGSLALAGFVLISAAVLRFDRALMRLATEENHAERRYAARMLDFVGNISALASLRLQEPTRRLLDARLAAVFRPLARSIVLTEWKWCTVDLLTVALAWGLVAVYAAATLAPGAGATLLIGNLFMVQQYANQAGGVLGSMAAHYQGLAHRQADYASAEPIREAPQAEPPGPAGDGWQRLELHGLSYAHDADADGRPRGGIQGVTLELRRGERVALVGPSGSGKSTLLRVLAGLYAAQQGAVVVDGVCEPGRRDAAALATLIPQEAEIFEATVRENLAFGEPVDEAVLARALHTAALDEVLAGMPQGLQTPMSERGFNLSGGQRQRLALARGVLAARGSSLLLLDEPTSALDPLIERHVQQRIERAFAGACIVASVHRLSLLAHFDRVVFMQGGRVADTGTVAELAARQPVFAAMLAGAEPAPAQRS